MKESDFPGWAEVEVGDIMVKGDAMCYKPYGINPDDPFEHVQGWANSPLTHERRESYRVFRRTKAIPKSKVVPLPLP